MLRKKSKYWDYSPTLNKPCVDMNKFVCASFIVGHSPPDGLFIRALPIYAQAGFFTSPVKRCPNHASPDDHTNKDPVRLDSRDHWIRVDNDFAMYEEDQESKQPSVINPVQPPLAGSLSFAVPIVFMTPGFEAQSIFTASTLSNDNRSAYSHGRSAVAERRVHLILATSNSKKEEQEDYDEEHTAKQLKHKGTEPLTQLWPAHQSNGL